MKESRYVVTIRKQDVPVTIIEDDKEIRVTVNGHEYHIDVRRITGTPLWSVLANNHAHKSVLAREGDDWKVIVDGAGELVRIGSERDLLLRKFSPAKSQRAAMEVVKSPMPGLVLAVRVREGDHVVAGQCVATVEAMKMENEFKATSPGVVTKVHVKPGDSVAKGAPLVSLKAE